MTSRSTHLARRLWWPICAVAALIFLRGCAYALLSGDTVNSRKAASIEAGIQDLRQLRFKQPVPLVVKTPDEAQAMIEADLMRDYTENRLEADAVAGALTGLFPVGLDLKAASIEAGIQDLRQLRFKQPVPLVVKTPDEAQAMIEADLMRDYTENRLEADAVAGALTGLFPVGLDLKAASLKLLKSQVAGFYDPHGKEMVLVEGGADLGIWNSAAQFMIQRDVVGEMLLAHELTHALQDQNFNLESSLDKVKNDDDRTLALKSVAEGDATISGFAYALGRMDDSTADALADNLKQLPQALAAQAPNTPEGLSVPLLFQYSDGVRFVAEAYRRGGWAAVDALYRKPPESTHQILHPALYFDSNAPTPRIELAGYDQIMSGWKKADDDTYGELLLRVILERNLGQQSNEVGLAARWTADRMVILQQSRSVNVIWMLAFEDAQTASHFAVVYETLLDRLLGDSTPHRIDARSNAVLIVIGEGADYFDTLAPSIWNASAIETGGVTARIQPSGDSLIQ